MVSDIDNIVISIHGASVPIAGSLTIGNVLQVNGASSLTYSAVNLAGGSNYVTGTLPTSNQASQIMLGDITGTTAASVVSSISGTSPIAITPNVLQWAAGATTPTLKQADSVSSTGNDLTIQAQNAGGSNHNGGNLILKSGAQTGSGIPGNVQLQGNSIDIKSNTGSISFATANHGIYLNDYTSGNQGIVFSIFSTASGINNEMFFAGTSAGFIAVDPYTSAASGNGKDLVIQAGLAASGNNNSGNLNLHAGAKTGSGTKGAIRLRINGTTGNSTTTETLLEIAEIASGRRVVSINRDADLTTTEMPTNTGDLVTFIGDASTVPTANAVGGGILYSDSGALKWRGSSGTTTVMGVADLEGFAEGNGHCPVCGTDFAHEWKNDEYGSLTICMSCLAKELGDRPWIVRGK